jgi:hypothetical protein
MAGPQGVMLRPLTSEHLNCFSIDLNCFSHRMQQVACRVQPMVAPGSQLNQCASNMCGMHSSPWLVMDLARGVVLVSKLLRRLVLAATSAGFSSPYHDGILVCRSGFSWWLYFSVLPWLCGQPWGLVRVGEAEGV